MRVQIKSGMPWGSAEVYVVFYWENSEREITLYNPYTQEAHVVNTSEPLPQEYFAKFSGFDWEKLKAELRELLNSGTKIPDEKKMEGELMATKYHLEDLRFLLKIGERK